MYYNMIPRQQHKILEELERDYLERIYFLLNQDLQKMIDGLNSKDKIKEDWVKKFQRIDKQRQNSDFARGAERIYYWLFSQFGKPNSSPIGADLFFEDHNAFIHIDIKTAKINNPSDYKGRVPMSENQTSYSSLNKKFNANLPHYYKYQKKPCLTYIINIIYDDAKSDFKIKAVFLIAVPNGELYKYYGDNIIGAGKIKGRSFRFVYKNSHQFKLLIPKTERIKILFLDEDLKGKEEKLLGFKFKKGK